MNKFRLKGNRDYIRGIDIYTYFIKNEFRNIKINFFKKIKSQPKLVKITKNNMNLLCCSIEFSINRKKFKLILINSKKKITDRLFEEERFDSIKKKFSLTKNSISCNFKSDLLSIEILSLMFKHYHNKKIKKSNWQITKLKLVKKLSDLEMKKYSIKMKRQSLKRFTVMSIYQKNKLIGEVEHVAVE